MICVVTISWNLVIVRIFMVLSMRRGKQGRKGIGHASAHHLL